MKIRGDQRKYLLRKVLGNLLPPEHLARKKKGFRVPLVPWMRGGLRNWTQDILTSESGASQFLNAGGVQQMWDGFSRGQSHYADILSITLSFLLSAPEWTHAASEPLRQVETSLT
jgi:asparagine synthase (glutamine-hydrolysing)